MYRQITKANKNTGRYRLATGIKANNLIGWGDELKVDLMSSNNANLKNARLDYSSLIDGYATRLGLTANYLDYELGGNFKALQSQGILTILGLCVAPDNPLAGFSVKHQSQL